MHNTICSFKIPLIPSLLWIFILVACYFLISDPACSCCSLPYRWNMQASLSHSQEYSWSDDWQSRRTTCKKTKIRKLRSRNNRNCGFSVFSKNYFRATERNILLGKHAPIQTVSPRLPLSLRLSLFTAGMCIWTEHSLAMSAVFAANLQAEFGSQNVLLPKQHILSLVAFHAEFIWKSKLSLHHGILRRVSEIPKHFAVRTRCSKDLESKEKYTG